MWIDFIAKTHKAAFNTIYIRTMWVDGGNMEWKVFHNKITALAVEKGIPLSGAFELTSRCNFNCRMCYVAASANDRNVRASELTADQWLDMGRQARNAGTFYLILTGGEIFLREDFEKIYEGLCEMGLNITLYTNASLITPERARWLGKIPPNKVSVTLYGASAETYEKVTGSGENYYKTLRALESLMAENIRLEVKTTVVEGNKKDYKELLKIAHNYSKGLGIVNYISPRREGCGSDPLGNRLSAKDLVEYENTVQEYIRKNYDSENRLDVRIDDDTMQEKTMLKEETLNIIKSSAFRCQAGKTGYWITWDGRMIPCGLLDTPSAKPLEESFIKAWEQVKSECLKVPKCNDCEVCELKSDCMACPGRLNSETGCFTKPAKYLCDSARLRRKLKQMELAEQRVANQ